MSTNDIELKRAYVNSLYHAPSWKRRVRRMPDSQIIAIYLREKAKETTAKREHK